MRIDINVDLSEGAPNDLEMLRRVSSANICLGEHAGNRDLTLRTVQICIDLGIRVGIHPGFPDRVSFGRVPPRFDQRTEFGESILMQVEWAQSEFDFAYVKPHGAWYNLICSNKIDDDVRWARKLLTEVTAQVDKPCMLLGSIDPSWFSSECILEGFADRGYTPEGELISRGEPGAILRSQREVESQVERLCGSVDSLCIHGDGENCVEIADWVRNALDKSGIEVGF